MERFRVNGLPWRRARRAPTYNSKASTISVAGLALAFNRDADQLADEIRGRNRKLGRLTATVPSTFRPPLSPPM